MYQVSYTYIRLCTLADASYCSLCTLNKYIRKSWQRRNFLSEMWKRKIEIQSLPLWIIYSTHLRIWAINLKGTVAIVFYYYLNLSTITNWICWILGDFSVFWRLRQDYWAIWIKPLPNFLLNNKKPWNPSLSSRNR